jgi:tRNA nucleotidyltransferase (CCA-adding enzyme)|tara:strand:- start:12249 stop:13763 length:1515 start_codon:yes stop_codon:yes gene_type:complete
VGEKPADFEAFGQRRKLETPKFRFWISSIDPLFTFTALATVLNPDALLKFMDKLLSETLQTITPNKKERDNLRKFAKKVITQLNKHGFEASVEGSLAKDTWISGNHDLDVFMYFDKESKRIELEEKGVEIGKKVIKELGGVPELAYSEHPYTRTHINNIDLDIVPCYKLKTVEERSSSVDRTPFHTKYILEKLTEKQRGDVRLLKQFTKGVGVYSAKEKVRGFSGYLCELLILKYGSFKKLAKEVAKWEYELVIDLEKHHKSKKKAHKHFKDALVVIDPCDSQRNVAAALDENNFEKLIFAFRNFLKKPTIQFFFPNLVEPYNETKLAQEMAKHGDIFVIRFKTPKLQEDILYSQLRKSRKVIRKKLEHFEFKVMQTDMLSNKESFLLFEVENAELPEILTMEGPPISIDQKYQDAFTSKYKKEKPWIKNKQWYVNVPRKYRTVQSLLKNIIAEPEKNGVAKYVIKSWAKKCDVLDSSKILDNYKGEFSRFLTRYLSKKQPWEW